MAHCAKKKKEEGGGRRYSFRTHGVQKLHVKNQLLELKVNEKIFLSCRIMKQWKLKEKLNSRVLWYRLTLGQLYQWIRFMMNYSSLVMSCTVSRTGTHPSRVSHWRNAKSFTICHINNWHNTYRDTTLQHHLCDVNIIAPFVFWVYLLNLSGVKHKIILPIQVFYRKTSHQNNLHLCKSLKNKAANWISILSLEKRFSYWKLTLRSRASPLLHSEKPS